MMQLCDVHSTPLRAHHGIVDSHFGLLRGRSSGRFAEFFGYERYLMVISRVLTGRGADIILIDDPLKPEEALSEAQRQACNEWYDHTLYSRLNDKRHGAIVAINAAAARRRSHRPRPRAGGLGNSQLSSYRRNRRGAPDRDDLGTGLLHAPSG